MNLDKILDERAERCRCNECMKKVLRGVVKQALELAAERAYVNHTPVADGRSWTVNKDSILNIIEEIE